MTTQQTFRVVIKEIPGDDDSFLVSPFPAIRDSIVRSYRIVAKDQISKMEKTGEKWTSMGRSFDVVDITIKEDATVPLSVVLSEISDEKVVEPKTNDSVEVALRSVQLNGGKGGIYVMGSCESCWCDSIWC